VPGRPRLVVLILLGRLRNILGLALGSALSRAAVSPRPRIRTAVLRPGSFVFGCLGLRRFDLDDLYGFRNVLSVALLRLRNRRMMRVPPLSYRLAVFRCLSECLAYLWMFVLNVVEQFRKVIRQVREVKKGVLLLADIHESRLDARHDLPNAAQINVAECPLVLRVFNEELYEFTVFYDGYTCLLFV